MNISGQKRQGGIQGLRAIACFAVLIQHVTYYACITRGIDYRNYLLIDFGRIGVFLFFMISGYVMGRCIDQGKSFLWNRAARIYPPFWIAAVISYPLLAHSDPSWHFDLKSLLLLPSDNLNNSYRVPYWTLCYEIAFYCVTYVFALTGATQRQIVTVCLLWLLAIFSFDTYRHAWGIGYADQGMFMFEPGWWMLLSPTCIFYVIGFLASTVGLEQLDKVKSAHLAVVSVLLYFVGTNSAFSNTSTGFGVLSIAYLLALVLSQRVLKSRVMSMLGDYSYGAYLIHMPVIAAMCAWFAIHAPHTRFIVLWVLLMASAILFGCLFGAFEYRLHRKVFKRSVKHESVVDDVQHKSMA